MQNYFMTKVEVVNPGQLHDFRIIVESSVLIVSASFINIIVYLGTRFGSKCLKSRNGNYKNYEENIKEVEAENSLLVY